MYPARGDLEQRDEGVRVLLAERAERADVGGSRGRWSGARVDGV